jgi:integration host factor subunit beta
MTKADLVERVTELGDHLTRRDGEVIVETLFDSIVGALKSDDKVEVRGFGSFRSRMRKPRTGRNPKTGASVDVPAKRMYIIRRRCDAMGVRFITIGRNE